MFCFCSRDDATPEMPQTSKTWPGGPGAIPRISETLSTLTHSPNESMRTTRTKRSYAELNQECKLNSEKEIEY